MLHEQKDGNIIKLVSKSLAAAVTDINYCNIFDVIQYVCILKLSVFWKIWQREGS